MSEQLAADLDRLAATWDRLGYDTRRSLMGAEPWFYFAAACVVRRHQVEREGKR